MRRFLIVCFVILPLSACSGGSAPAAGGGTATAGATSTTIEFKGAIAGVASLTGEGAGHLCGRQGNGSYEATTRTTLSDQTVVVLVQLPQFNGPGDYPLGGGAGSNSVTVTIEDAAANPILGGGQAWRSTSGHVTIDRTDQYTGSMDVVLQAIGGASLTSPTPRSSGAESLSGQWSCERTPQ